MLENIGFGKTYLVETVFLNRFVLDRSHDGHMVDDRLPPRKVLYTQMTVKEYVHKKMYKKHCVPKTYKSMHKQKGISKLCDQNIAMAKAMAMAIDDRPSVADHRRSTT